MSKCVTVEPTAPYVTRAPIVTRAPVTRAPVTRAPVTRAPVTSAPEGGASTPEQVCRQPKDTGLCRAYMKRW